MVSDIKLTVTVPWYAKALVYASVLMSWWRPAECVLGRAAMACMRVGSPSCTCPSGQSGHTHAGWCARN